MCVRYTLHKTDAALAAIARALAIDLAFPGQVDPSYNVTLTNVMPVVARVDSSTLVRSLMWGFPMTSKGGKPGVRLIPNARAETVARLPMFRDSVRNRRCLVPANGFYEWREEAGHKQPYLFSLRDEESFAFAGIWGPLTENRPGTYCILTTKPNTVVAPIHNRMPVLLVGETMARWLGSEALPEEDLVALTQPFDPDRMIVRPVNRFVNNSRNQGPRCLSPPDEPEPELNLG